MDIENLKLAFQHGNTCHFVYLLVMQSCSSHPRDTIFLSPVDRPNLEFKAGDAGEADMNCTPAVEDTDCLQVCRCDMWTIDYLDNIEIY